LPVTFKRIFFGTYGLSIKNKDKAPVGVEVIKGAHPYISENIFA
jgi:hypothetical protein